MLTVDFLVQWNPSLFPPWGPARGGGGSHVALNFKTSPVGVYKCLSLIVGFAITVTIWPREVVSCRDFIFHFLSLLFRPCCLSEFTLAGPPPCQLFWPSKMAIHFLIKKPLIINTVTYQYGQQPHFKIPNSRIFSNYTPLIRPCTCAKFQKLIWLWCVIDLVSWACFCTVVRLYSLTMHLWRSKSGFLKVFYFLKERWWMVH